MRVPQMASDRHAIIDEFNDSFGGVRRQGEVELDSINASFEEIANFLGNSIRRRNAVEHFPKRTAVVETLVRTIQQRTENKHTWSQLLAAVEIGFELFDLVELGADIAYGCDAGSKK